MSRVCVLDTTKQPLMPCSPRRVRVLLSRGKATLRLMALAGLFSFTMVTMGGLDAMASQLQPGRYLASRRAQFPGEPVKPGRTVTISASGVKRRMITPIGIFDLQLIGQQGRRVVVHLLRVDPPLIVVGSEPLLVGKRFYLHLSSSRQRLA